MEKKKKDIVANLLDLPELEPETTSVEITRLGIVFELKELPYDKLTNPELKQEAWYRDKQKCATPADALKKLLRRGEVSKIVQAIDLLNGYGAGSVVPAERERAALSAAVEELEKN